MKELFLFEGRKERYDPFLVFLHCSAIWKLKYGNSPELVKFTIDSKGAVSKTETHATSMRHPPTEDCINGVVAKATFPAPALGAK
ncbi:MAG: hypothetical protein QGH94_13845, partial [Phycisphaerae bacterium]|nr:hypothetical protein [Phycisphaerae bacterium]